MVLSKGGSRRPSARSVLASSQALFAVLMITSASLADLPFSAGAMADGAQAACAVLAQPDDYLFLSDHGMMTYTFNAAVDVGKQSQPFFFTVPSGTSPVPDSATLNVEMTYYPLRSGTCDLDLSVWNPNRQRTGGILPLESASSTSIPHSDYSSSGGVENVEVEPVTISMEGLWMAVAYCKPGSSAGARFTLAARILLSSAADEKAFEFSVASNSCGLEVGMVSQEGHEFDVGLLDGFGRRTGGRTDTDDQPSAWIPDSVYSGADSSPETIAVAPVSATDGRTYIGELWRAAVHHVSGDGQGNFALWIELAFDSDSDGAADWDDIDPVHDLCVRLLVTNIRELDPIDSGDNTFDPYVRVAVGEALSKADPVGSPGDAWESHIWSSSIQPIQFDGNFTGEYSMWKNVPDDVRVVSIFIQVWDADSSDDDICDISPVIGGGSESKVRSSTLSVDYDLIDQLWTGDVTDGYSSGEEDGSAGSARGNDDDDVEISFSITTSWEIPFADKVLLANTYSPLLFLDSLEDSGPLEVWAMLNQSDLRDSATRAPLVEHPLSQADLSAQRTGSYLKLVDRETDRYRNQVYANVLTSDEDTVVIQYWFFYLYDSVSPHEGDWEMIQVVFAKGSRLALQGYIEPSWLVYSQHFDGESRSWSDPTAPRSDTHPWVLVEHGGHASLFSGSDEESILYPVSIMSPSPWLNYAGKWGSSRWKIGPGGVSVQGPVFRASMNRDWLGKPTSPVAYMWHEPLHWAEGFK